MSDKSNCEPPKKRVKVDNVKLYFSLRDKPRCTGMLSLPETVQLVQDRDLLNKDKKWDDNDIKAIGNLLVGKGIIIRRADPEAKTVSDFLDKVDEEIAFSPLLQQIMDPPVIIFHTLPVQANNGNNALAPFIHFEYPTWPVVMLNIPGAAAVGGAIPQGIEATPSNVPLQWTGLINRAHHNLWENVPGINLPAGGAAVVANIVYKGDAAALPLSPRITMLVPNNPFILEFVDITERNLFMAFIRADLQARFGGAAAITAFSYSSLNIQGATRFHQA